MKIRDKKNHNFTKFGETDEDEEDEGLKAKTKATKSERNLNKQRKKEFLEDKEYAEISSKLFASECSPEIKEFDNTTHDAWVVQCPKGMNLSALLNKRIKLPGRRYVSDIQVRATNYEAPFSQSVGYVNIKGKYALRQLPLIGHMMVSRRIHIEQLSTDEETKVVPEASGSQKVKLPVRHPFFGRDYQSRIEVDKKTTKRLRKADQRSAEMKARLSSTGNFYKIRQQLLATTQTLEQKEHDVRQSVLTGVAPKFMTKSEHPSYVNLSKDVEIKQKETSGKQLKRKSDDPIKSQSTDESDDFKAKPKKKRKRQTISDNDNDVTQEEATIGVTKSEPTEDSDVGIPKSKKKKKRLTNTESNIDLTQEAEVPAKESNNGNNVVPNSEPTDDLDDGKTIIKKKKKKRPSNGEKPPTQH